jgi:Flp pilus assembly protein TadB
VLLASLASLAVLLWNPRQIQRWLQRSENVDEARFLGSVASELRSGASLRVALAGAAGESDHGVLRGVHRLALSGAPLESIADALASLPINGGRLRTALRVAAVAGGSSVAVFDRLTERAVDEAALARERRTLTAQARFSAGVVVALPSASLVLGGGARIGDLVASGPGGLTIAVAGLALQVCGAAAVWWMARS